MNDPRPTNPSAQQLAEFALSSVRWDSDCAPSNATQMRALELARCLPMPRACDSGASPCAWWDRARAALATLTQEHTVLCGAGLRGGSIRAMEFVQGDVHMDLEVEPLVRHTSRRGIVRGQVEASTQREGVPVVLVDDAGNEAASTTLDDLGFFSVLLPAGNYAVAVALPTGAIIATGVFVQ